MKTDSESYPGGPINRRTVAKGMAWSVPAVTVAGTAPVMASSLRKDPGINGWVRNTTTPQGGCAYTLRVDSNPNNPSATPDGAPFGLYVYDSESTDIFSNISLVYWIIGNQNASWSTNGGHSACWNAPVRGTPSTKADGFTYTPYTFTYNCPLLAADVSGDGRLFLGEFDTTASFTQPRNRCSDVTYWTQRFITIAVNGTNPEVFTFERRNGTRGSYTGTGARSAQGAESTESASGSTLT